MLVGGLECLQNIVFYNSTGSRRVYQTVEHDLTNVT